MLCGRLRPSKQDKIVVVGFDADPEAKDAVRLGEMDATVGSPYKLGVMGIEASFSISMGNTA